MYDRTGRRVEFNQTSQNFEKEGGWQVDWLSRHGHQVEDDGEERITNKAATSKLLSHIAAGIGGSIDWHQSFLWSVMTGGVDLDQLDLPTYTKGKVWLALDYINKSDFFLLGG